VSRSKEIGASSMGKSQRDKGARVERKVVDLFEMVGIKAQRVPLSGAAGGQFQGDILFDVEGWIGKAEVKARANAEGWKSIITWLDKNDMLVLVQDRKDPLIVLPWYSFTTLIDKIPSKDWMP